MIKRQKILMLLTAMCICLGMMLLTGDKSAVTELTFSRESGFYEQPFTLKISAPPGTEIYYTLDGSEPDENAIKYAGPISITDATENENIYSMRTDVSAGFLKEKIARYSRSDPQYVVPDYPVDKCTVVRAAYRDADGNFSETKTENYFVGFDNKIGYDDIYVMSIVTDPDNLFDEETGIYVLGNIFQETERSAELGEYWWWWNANYHQRGLEWERIADVQLFDASRQLIQRKSCGIRIQGGGSRGNVPKSMNIYARDIYDGEGRFYIDLFGSGYMADTITLFAGGDDKVAKIRDMLMARLTEGRAFATMHYIPCAMFLDGEYWGVYWLTEKYDDAYLSYYYHVKKNNVIMIKSTTLAEGNEEDNELYVEQILKYMVNTDMKDEGNYQYACELIDMQSYIDYYASEIYIGRYNDWPNTNEGLWRVREKDEDNIYSDGKWRWMLFDVNSGALSSNLIDSNTIASARLRSRHSEVFNNLCQNPDFQKQFVITFMDLANTTFARERVDAIVQECTELMTEPMQVHRKRFWGSEDTTVFLDAVADVQNFLDCRRPYIVQYLKEEFGLTGSLASVALEVNDTAAGKVVLNTIEPPFDENGKWSGEYYTDYPITLTASANEGYRFVAWEVKDARQTKVIQEEKIELPVSEGGMSVKAIYEEK